MKNLVVGVMGMCALLAFGQERRENRNLVERVFYFADHGAARIVETATFSGQGEQAQRETYARIAPERFVDLVRPYVRDFYSSDQVVSATFSDPGDQNTPMSTRIEVAHSPRAFTESNRASTAIELATLIELLPEPFLAGESARNEPFILEAPMVQELRYRLVPPFGFALDGDLPESKNVALGHFTLEMRFRQESDTSLTAVLRLSGAQAELTPEQFEATRRALGEARETEPIGIGFLHEAQQRWNAGDWPAALIRFRDFQFIQADQAIHRVRYANALLEAGLGEAARRVAREAVKINPGSALAQAGLARILQHDLTGRVYQPGFDLGGAIAAYRQAVELEPHHMDYRADLAFLLEFDHAGFRVSPYGDLDSALEQYQQLQKTLASDTLYQRMLNTQMTAGRFREATRVLPEIRDQRIRTTYDLATTAVLEGRPAAEAKAHAITSQNEQVKNLSAAGMALIQTRQYAAAAALFDVAAKTNPAARARADRTREIKPFETIKWDPRDPVAVVRRFMAGLFMARAGDFSALKPLVSEAVYTKGVTDRENGFGAMQSRYFATARKTRISPVFMADTIASVLPISHEGDAATGYRVTLEEDFLRSRVKRVFYLAPSAGRVVIAGMNGFEVQTAGRVFAFFEADQTQAAERWLSWKQVS